MVIKIAKKLEFVCQNNNKQIQFTKSGLKMDPWRKLKSSGTFKRNVKKNFNKIVSLNPVLCKRVLQVETPVADSGLSSLQISRTSTDDNTGTPECSSSSFESSSAFVDAPEFGHLADEEEYSEFGTNDDVFANLQLLADLQSWAVEFNIRQSALKELLSILNTRLSNVLPRDPRTLLKTAQSVEIMQMEGGQYWHQGVKSCIERVFSEITEPLLISLKFNIDGLPVYKSSKDEFWPILMNIEEFPEVEPMIVGIYAGKQKPSSIMAFLTPFADEMEKVCEEGLHVNGHKITVKVRCFICDSPARAFIKGIH